MAGSYILTATNITDTSVDILVTDESSVAAEGVEVTMTGGISSVTSDSEGIASFTGLTASTSYTASVTNDSVTFTTKATGYNTPRAATQEQWEDLVERVEAASHDIGYSTSEVDTGATWIDGSKIYKKTLEFTTSSTDFGIDTGVSNINMLIRLESIIITSATRQYVDTKIGSDGAWDNAKGFRINLGQFNKDSGVLRYDFGSAYSGEKTIYATIWYIKSS